MNAGSNGAPSEETRLAPLATALPVTNVGSVVPTRERAVSVRAVRALTRAVPHLRYRLAKLGLAGQVGVTGLLTGVVVLLSVVLPARNTIQALSVAVEHAQSAPRTFTVPQDPLSSAVGPLPTADQLPEILGKIFDEAQQAGVSLERGQYAFTAGSGAVARYSLEFPVKATYPQIRGFLDKTLSAIPSVGLQKLRLERKAVGDAIVNADVDLVIYVGGE